MSLRTRKFFMAQYVDSIIRHFSNLWASGDPSLEGVEGEPRSMCGLLGFIDLLAGM